MRKIIVAACVLAMAWTPGAYATTLVKMNLGDLTGEAEAIVSGTVTSSHSAWNEDRSLIFTHSTLAVGSTLKGKHKAEVVVRTHGGIVGDIGMRMIGEPELKKGDQVLLFLERDSEGRNRVVGMSQGCFRLKTGEGGQKLVSNPLSGLSLYDRAKGLVVDPSSEVKQGTRLDELEKKIRALLARKDRDGAEEGRETDEDE